MRMGLIVSVFSLFNGIIKFMTTFSESYNAITQWTSHNKSVYETFDANRNPHSTDSRWKLKTSNDTSDKDKGLVVYSIIVVVCGRFSFTFETNRNGSTGCDTHTRTPTLFTKSFNF